jgi:hypothetical protein
MSDHPNPSVSSDQEHPAKKARRTREKLPEPSEDDYAERFYVGRPLFGEQEFPLENAKQLYPTWFALEAKKNAEQVYTKKILPAHWNALSRDEIRFWNNKVEPDHEAQMTKRRALAAAGRAAVAVAWRAKRNAADSVNIWLQKKQRESDSRGVPDDLDSFLEQVKRVWNESLAKSAAEEASAAARSN